MSLCMATTSVPGTLPNKLEVLADAGFDSVELHEPDFIGFAGSAQDVKSLVDSFGLQLAVLQPFHGLEGLSGAEREQAFDRLKHKLDLANSLGVGQLLVASSAHAECTNDLQSIKTDFADAADLAIARGIRIALLARPWAKTLNSDQDAWDVVNAVDRSNFGLALNSFFSLADGTKPAKLRDMSGEKLFHVQLSDAPASKIDIRFLKNQLGLLPGQGSLNLKGFVRVLARNGYKGNWSLARLGAKNMGGSASQIASDGYRSLVNLLDDVARIEPAFQPNLPDLPPRVYASGFEFIEFAAQETDGELLVNTLESMSFRRERQHISKSVELWRQGAINIVVNKDKNGFAHQTYLQHGPSVCDMGLRVEDANQTVERASGLGTKQFSQPVGSGELDIPAIKGVGGNVVHFIDEKSDLHRVWDIEFDLVPQNNPMRPAGLRRIDHVAQTMKYQEMQSWLLYYTSTFEMEKSTIVDVADPSGSVLSQVLSSPEGEVRLNLNGAQSNRTFAGSFLAERYGAGVQHIAFSTDDIFETSQVLQQSNFDRLTISPNYYADLQAHFGLQDEMVEKLRDGNILYEREGQAEYFQIYSKSLFNGFFFEIVERRNGFVGYGARNAAVRLASQSNYQMETEELG